MSSMVTCSACNRHLRRSESACPFCGADVAATIASAPERVMPEGRLGRAALFAFAATVGSTACGTENSIVAVYGAPIVDGSASSGGETGAGGKGTGGELAGPVYGAPIVKDAGSDAAGDGATDAAAGGTSGAGGRGSGGSFAALYGATPAPNK